MKKKVLLASTVFVALALTVYGFSKKEKVTKQVIEPVKKEVASLTPTEKKINNRIFTDFIYDIGPRFRPIKKTKLNKATSAKEFLRERELENIMFLKSVSVILIIDDKQSDIRETGTNFEFNKAQLDLLQQSDYSTNFIVRADYQWSNPETGAVEDSYATPHHTIVPEKQAVYATGKDALKTFLKDKSKSAIAHVEADKLKPAKLFFTVTKNGLIKNVRLDRSSGYPEVDKKMIELIKQAPDKWSPAENANGEKVNQELVVSFGLMGC